MLRLVSKTTALNQSQKTQPNVSLIGNSNVIGPGGITLYTVPPGKRALVMTASYACVNIGGGGGTYVKTSYGGIQGIYFAAATVNFVPQLDNSIGPNGLLLTAGQTIVLVADGAGNASCNYIISIQETPA